MEVKRVFPDRFPECKNCEVAKGIAIEFSDERLKVLGEGKHVLGQEDTTFRMYCNDAAELSRRLYVSVDASLTGRYDPVDAINKRLSPCPGKIEIAIKDAKNNLDQMIQLKESLTKKAVVCTRCRLVVTGLGEYSPQNLVHLHSIVSGHSFGHEVFWTTSERLFDLRKQHNLVDGSIGFSPMVSGLLTIPYSASTISS